MFDRRLSIKEFYVRFDDNNTGRLGATSIAKIIKSVMASASSTEIKQLTKEFVSVFDIDSDGFISMAEFQRAMELGEPELPMLEENWDVIDMRTDYESQGRGLSSRCMDRLRAEHEMLNKVGFR